jgi:hypothetical protein
MWFAEDGDMLHVPIIRGRPKDIENHPFSAGVIMTDLKMCKFRNGDWLDGEYIIGNWIPIDPQPSCETCIRKTGCAIWFQVRESYLFKASPHFFCEYWDGEAKK